MTNNDYFQNMASHLMQSGNYAYREYDSETGKTVWKKLPQEVSAEYGETLHEMDEAERLGYDREIRMRFGDGQLQEDQVPWLDSYDGLTDREDPDYSDLYACLDQLLEEQRWLILELYGNQRKIIDIARELGITEAAVRNRRNKIIERLRKLLSERGFGFSDRNRGASTPKNEKEFF